MSSLPTKEVRVELGFMPYPHQGVAHAMRLVFRFLVLVWHRRAGKTVFAVMELLLAALECKQERGRFAYIAPFLRQAKTVSWDYLKHYARLMPGAAINESELSVLLPNGASIRLFGADNPDAFRGQYFDGVVLDEVADMKPEVWGEILRPALADREGWALFIGTPKGVNLFSELYQRASRGEVGWGCALLRASDTAVIPEAELEQARHEMTEAQFAQEFDVDFQAAAEDVLIRLDAVLAAQKRVLVERDYAHAAKVLGVDVGRYGGDRSVLFPRQGLAAFTPDILKAADTMAVAGRVAHTAEKWEPDAVFVDVGGIGAGVVDRLLQLKVRNVIPVDFGSRATDPGRFENKRVEMWWTMAEWVKQGTLPGLQELQLELPAPRFSYRNARGRIELESKDDMKARGLRSPDVADALACTFAFPVMPAAMAAGGDKVEHEYNPYEERR